MEKIFEFSVETSDGAVAIITEVLIEKSEIVPQAMIGIVQGIRQNNQDVKTLFGILKSIVESVEANVSIEWEVSDRKWSPEKGGDS